MAWLVRPVAILFVAILHPQLVSTMRQSAQNLTWTEYHPLEHHQQYLQHLQQRYPRLAQVRLPNVVLLFVVLY